MPSYGQFKNRVTGAGGGTLSETLTLGNDAGGQSIVNAGNVAATTHSGVAITTAGNGYSALTNDGTYKNFTGSLTGSEGIDVIVNAPNLSSKTVKLRYSLLSAATPASSDEYAFYRPGDTTHYRTTGATLLSWAFSSPNLTGTATAPTVAQGDSSTKIATTSFVTTAIGDYINQISRKDAVRVYVSSNIDISSALVAGAVVDGVTLAAGDRALLNAQSNPAENGIYIVAASGAASRAPDANSSNEVKPGMTTFISEGATYSSRVYSLSTDDPITLDTTGLTFVQTGGPGIYSAGSGLQLTGGTQFSLNISGLSATTIADADKFAIYDVSLAGHRSITLTDLKTNLNGTYLPLAGGTMAFGASIVFNSGSIANAVNITATNTVQGAQLTAVGAGATTSLLSLSNATGTVNDYITNAAPGGSLSAPAGSIARHINGTSTEIYVNKSATTGTVWAPLTPSNISVISVGGQIPQSSAAIADTVYYSKFVAPADMTLVKLSFLLTEVPASGTENGVQMAIYDSSLARLKTTASLSITNATATGYVSLALSSAQQVTAGTEYWLALISPTGLCQFGYSSVYPSSAFYRAQNTGALPTTMSGDPTTKAFCMQARTV